ncbi:hypothetical protein HMPREF0262_01855 [Clostridium sp. ATCC 29733]|nr:hypothetical protein HMPREF0262_01855 [Clostridium sp. ATCC 29733]
MFWGAVPFVRGSACIIIRKHYPFVYPFSPLFPPIIRNKISFVLCETAKI